MVNAYKLCSIMDAMLERQAGSSSQAGTQQRSDDAAALQGSHLPAPPGGDGPQHPLLIGTEEAEQ